jgi:hypothetical protein
MEVQIHVFLTLPLKEGDRDQLYNLVTSPPRKWGWVHSKASFDMDMKQDKMPVVHHFTEKDDLFVTMEELWSILRLYHKVY